MRGKERTSMIAFEELKESGDLSRAQAMYVAVIANSENGLTHRQANDAVFQEYGRRLSARNGNFIELIESGFLVVTGQSECEVTKKLVNVYDWTGRTTPLPSRDEWVSCEKCGGKGGHMKKVYSAQPAGDLFGGGR